MSDNDQAFWLQVIQIVAPIVAAVVAFFTLREQNKAKEQLKDVKGDIQQVKKTVDGQMTEVAKRAHAQGRAEATIEKSARDPSTRSRRTDRPPY